MFVVGASNTTRNPLCPLDFYLLTTVVHFELESTSKMIKILIAYTFIVASTFLSIYCIECGEYKVWCDNFIVIVWVVSYFALLVLNTRCLIIYNSTKKKIRNSAIVFSSYVATFFWIVMVNAEFKPLDMSVMEVIKYLVLGLISYIIVLSCVGILVSALTQYFFKRIRG